MLTKYSNQINNINIYYVLHLRYMLTFNNLIYRLINHSNKNVKLLTNEFIHIKDNKQLTLYNILTTKYKINPSSAKKINEFILPMLNLNPYERPTADECLHSKWLL